MEAAILPWAGNTTVYLVGDRPKVCLAHPPDLGTKHVACPGAEV